VIPNICVCICTFKRPELLAKLLRALQDQRTDGLFTVSAVVVDNDASCSARDTVLKLAAELKYPIRYEAEPKQNIALARNRGVLNADGEFIATIDDDEVPCKEWLFLLLQTLRACNADAVLGPVCPTYPPEAPTWLIRSGLCDRETYPTGTVLTREHPLRTGNTLLHRRIFADGKKLFREEYGRTGGEDGDFFAARVDDGFKFVWCAEAPAYEDVPPDRCVLSYYLKRFLRFGALTGKRMRAGIVPLWMNFFKSLAVSITFLPAIPVWALLGKHIFARNFSKYLYHLSRFLATLGIELLPAR
jgi:succinoglycan biosynthesis protein ExoM